MASTMASMPWLPCHSTMLRDAELRCWTGIIKPRIILDQSAIRQQRVPANKPSLANLMWYWKKRWWLITNGYSLNSIQQPHIQASFVWRFLFSHHFSALTAKVAERLTQSESILRSGLVQKRKSYACRFIAPLLSPKCSVKTFGYTCWAFLLLQLPANSCHRPGHTRTLHNAEHRDLSCSHRSISEAVRSNVQM